MTDNKYTDAGHAGRIRERIRDLVDVVKEARAAGLHVDLDLTDDDSDAENRFPRITAYVTREL